jgi:hypothetical protein
VRQIRLAQQSRLFFGELDHSLFLA